MKSHSLLTSDVQTISQTLLVIVWKCTINCKAVDFSWYVTSVIELLLQLLSATLLSNGESAVIILL